MKLRHSFIRAVMFVYAILSVSQSWGGGMAC